MKEMVDELVVIVGGNRKAADGKSLPGRIGRDQRIEARNIKTFPLKNPKSKEVGIHRTQEVHPDQVIPMDDEITI